VIYRAHTTCRACSHPTLTPVLDLAEQPLANAFVRDGTPAPHAPLSVLLCERCSLAQLSVVVDPSVLYHASYAYTQQSRTASFKAHVATLLSAIRAELPRATSALEVGSNDGSFLAELRRSGFTRRMGIDPSATGLEPALRERFDTESATALRNACGPFDLVVGRHVFAHLNDWPGFITALSAITAPDGLAVLEVPDASALLAGNHWPTIYHEHLSYVSADSLRALLRGRDWHLATTLHSPIHGGSSVFMLRRGEDASPAPRLNALPEWRSLATRTHTAITHLRDLIRNLRSGGATIAAYGAPAKATVIAAACGFTQSDLVFCTDTTPSKAGCTLPGTDIPVVSPDALLTAQPDYALLMAYTYAEEIVARESTYRERGGRFILPVPEPRIL